MLWEKIMSDKKNIPDDLNMDVLIADLMLRVTTLERLLVSKGLLSESEMTKMSEEIAAKIAKTILEKVGASKEIEKLVEDLGGPKKDYNN